MNAVTRDGLTTAVQEHMLVMGPFVGKATEVLDGVGPERATSLLAPLAHDPDGPRVPVDVADPERCRLTHTRTRVVKEQQQGVIAGSLARRSIGSGKQRIDLRLLQVGDAGSNTLLDRHHPNLGAPFDVLWTVRTDEPGQSVYRAEALVPCGRGALPLALQMSEEGANHLGRQIGHCQRVDGRTFALCRIGKKQDEHVAIASTGVGRKVPFRCCVLQQEPADPMAERGSISHDGLPGRMPRSGGWLQQAAPRSSSDSVVFLTGPCDPGRSPAWAAGRSGRRLRDTRR